MIFLGRSRTLVINTWFKFRFVIHCNNKSLDYISTYKHLTIPRVDYTLTSMWFSWNHVTTELASIWMSLLTYTSCFTAYHHPQN